jgi:hypothetical protein
MVNEIREREEKAKALEEEYGRMNKTIHRGLYTRRILDIINSINKQKKGIDTVIQVRYSGITDNRYQPVKWGKMPASL